MTTQKSQPIQTNAGQVPSAEVFDPEPVADRAVFAPPVDVFENDDELLLVADVPGVAKDDVEIDVEAGSLRFRARRGTGDVQGALLAGGLGDFDYERAFRLPRGLDASRVSADLASGVLRIHLPKSADVKPRRIQVASA